MASPFSIDRHKALAHLTPSTNAECALRANNTTGNKTNTYHLKYGTIETGYAQSGLMAPTRPAEELYDLEKDPFELTNLADGKHHRGTVKRLRRVLDTWLINIDTAKYPEDSAEVSYAQALMKKEFAENMKKKGLSPQISDEAFLEYWKDTLAEMVGD